MKKTSDSLVIGFDSSAGKDGTVLIVGRKKPREAVDIINAFDILVSLRDKEVPGDGSKSQS